MQIILTVTSIGDVYPTHMLAMYVIGNMKYARTSYWSYSCSPSTRIGAGHQWTIHTSMCHFQSWFSWLHNMSCFLWINCQNHPKKLYEFWMKIYYFRWVCRHLDGQDVVPFTCEFHHFNDILAISKFGWHSETRKKYKGWHVRTHHMEGFVTLHSSLCNIMLVATKVDLVLRSFVWLTWLHDRRGLV